MRMLRFELRHSIKGGSYQHLALFGLHSPAGTPPQAHWILPHECPVIPELKHALLLTEADASTMPEQVLDEGPAGLSIIRFPIQRSVFQLKLILHGQHISGQFELQRLEPGGSLWLLDPVATLPPKPRNAALSMPPLYCTYAP
ncbi:hypothetical protein [Hymenobacter sp. BT190]|uniref:hypothetical protein n=1 Tax=Hymenobacter sp. BT190 TaxID=2763505 RepID=UPI0016514906|nr:hypothetical protein [Hymenobacter sp. BT190]MBC6698545.1 hypothetical protein [Hymenobacter sp. BT190]